MHDLLIRGGTVVDGTGAPGKRADVAVDGDCIVAVGENLGPAQREIDATGLLVTPGWVDIHTHYDGQATWDEELSPSGWNGVTTVGIGNCGVGFAPVKAEEREYLINLMEGVEDIPGAALSLGIKWDWETFPEYMDALEKMPRVADIVAQVPHGPIRTYVMGDRGANNEEATPEDVKEMARLVKEGMEAGALGFTSSRVLGHKSKDGDYVPGTFAEDEELIGILRTLGEVGYGTFGVASGSFISGDLTQGTPIPDEDEEMARLRWLAKESGRPVTFACIQNGNDPDQWKRLFAACDEAQEEGIQLVPQIQARPAGILMGFDGSVHPFYHCESFAPLLEMSREDRAAALRRPETRAALLEEEPDISKIPLSVQFIASAWDMMFQMSDPPDYEPKPETSLAAMAEREEGNPKELAYDMMLEGDYLYLPLTNYCDGNMDVNREMIIHNNAVLGLGDGGAHCGIITDASIPTFLLTHWVRDRSRGERLPLEWVVHRQTQESAQFCGLEDRGVIAEGMLADLNVIDFENLTLRKPHMVFDLPANERRLLQDVEGYRYTIKSGEITYEDGKQTGALPGGLVRGPQAAPAN
jgi:N-acyl-D-amino-acid deacylase